jgi:two-component system cell cycle sensor histidine kinase/response regulator CckA
MMRAARILLVEDDDNLRDGARDILTSIGWDVITAKDGAEALAIARKLDYAFELVLSDVVMPVMSGRQLVRQMLAERPGLRVMLMSGFDPKHDAPDPDIDLVPWIDKPFTAPQLIERVGRPRSS